MHLRFSRSLVLLIACTAVAVLRGMSPSDLSTRLGAGERLLLVDLRSQGAYTEGHIPGAINVPLPLLGHKQLPAGHTIVLYGDGLGMIDEAKGVAVLRSGQPGLNVEVLDGGYVVWSAETRMTTSAPGVRSERLPFITYQQVLDAPKRDLVIVDLRTAAAPATAAAGARTPARAASTNEPDLVGEFARKLGVPLVTSADTAPRVAASSTNSAGTPARAASAPAPADPSKLLVLVADSEATASQVARELRARGQYRFTVLVGGTESIRHEGRVGTGRMEGGTLHPQQP
jgi:rhodanese-related sulfurtransferase